METEVFSYKKNGDVKQPLTSSVQAEKVHKKDSSVPQSKDVSNNDGDVSIGHRHQPQGAPTGPNPG